MGHNYEINILIIVYNRPNYLIEVLDSLKYCKNIKNLFISIDKEKDIESDKLLVDEVIKISNDFIIDTNKEINILKEKRGCKGHVIYALDWVSSKLGNEEILLVLEDDVLLLPNTIDRIEDIINKNNFEYYVIKLNQYFWGWVTNVKTIKELTGGYENIINEFKECDYHYKKLNIFKDKYGFKNINEVTSYIEPFLQSLYVPWDESFPVIMRCKKIFEYKDNNIYTKNIGDNSSRDPFLEPILLYGTLNNPISFYVENGKPIYY